MALIPYHPFRELERFFEEEWPDLREWFQDWPRWRERLVPQLRAPRVDIYEQKGNVVAEVELPGVDPENIDVEIKDNVLKVEAKTEEKKEEKGKDYYRKEISSGYYKRAVALPVDVLEDKAEASYEDGILRVVMPKKEPAKGEKKGVKVEVKKGK